MNNELNQLYEDSKILSQEWLASVAQNQEADRIAEAIKKLALSLNLSDLQTLQQKLSQGFDLRDQKSLLAAIAVLERYVEDPLDKVKEGDQTNLVQRLPIVVILHNLKSAHNCGSLLRSAEAFGASEIIFSGYTPASDNIQFKKVSMGAESWIKNSKNKDINESIDQYKNENYEVVALETTKSAIALSDYQPQNNRVCFILGNERQGLPGVVLNQCDCVVEIPLIGQKNSINVANAGSVALYSISQSLTKRIENE